MKLKYYLRGLGIGIVVTALLMGVATKDNGVMSDEEVKARALQLGMVEQRTLADIRDNAVPTEEPIVTKAPEEGPPEEPGQPSTDVQEPEITQAPVETLKPEGSNEPEAGREPEITEEPTVTPEPETTEEPTVSQEPEQSPEVPEKPLIEDWGETVIIRIQAGDSSEVVSKRLEKAGLVDSASEFNQYLLKEKLTKVIDVGTYEIEKGSGMKEIATIITN